MDTSPKSSRVIRHNLSRGIPFESETFDLVYHSHVLEHFPRENGRVFMAECFRVLKPGGILRAAVPDLEAITRSYLALLEGGILKPNDKIIEANYDWIMLEMYDQAVRNVSGGEMKKYLSKKNMPNEAFVIGRVGEEGKTIRDSAKSAQSVNGANANGKPNFGKLIQSIKGRVNRIFNKNADDAATRVGRFRISGEAHQWMYDRYSMSRLLSDCGGEGIVMRDAFTSYIEGWGEYELDVKEKNVRKPDSLFIEAIKRQ